MTPRRPFRDLDVADYARLRPRLESLEMNTLFARAVLAGDAPGRVLVDSATSPSVAYVRHGYGMSLLLKTGGYSLEDDEYVETVLRLDRNAPEWLQVWPGGWASRFAAIAASPGERSALAAELHTRVNFSFSVATYCAHRAEMFGSPWTIARADRSTFSMAGSVVPRLFWNDADEFMHHGVGFVVMIEGRPASVAFAAFVTSSQLEIGVETVEEHRGRGLARLACAALIDHCLAQHLEPVWACRLDNRASCRLAESLGFIPARQLPYLRLPPTRPLESAGGTDGGRFE